jgi:arginyl-tRNA synthetase
MVRGSSKDVWFAHGNSLLFLLLVGLLAVGYEKYGDEHLLQTDPIHHLYQVYVKINQDAQLDPSLHQKANQYFKSMEQGQYQKKTNGL